MFLRYDLAIFTPKCKIVLDFYMSPLAYKTMKCSKFASKKLAATCWFLLWVNNCFRQSTIKYNTLIYPTTLSMATSPLSNQMIWDFDYIGPMFSCYSRKETLSSLFFVGVATSPKVNPISALFSTCGTIEYFITKVIILICCVFC